MSFTFSTPVVGVQKALKELNKVNPKLRREYTKRYNYTLEHLSEGLTINEMEKKIIP